MNAPQEKPARREVEGWPKLLIDFGPLVLFFIAYNRFDIFVATGVFMAAIAAAVVASWLLTRHVPAMLWFTAALVGVFGGMTLWLHDETFIKVKPTIIFGLFSAILWFGLWRGRSYLQLLLGKVFEGLSEVGWTTLTKRWAIFFALMAVANELLWRNFETSIWVHWKVWGDTVATLVFALAQTPMLLKHGLKLEK